MTMLNHRSCALIATLLAIALTGCSSNTPKPAASGLSRIDLQASADANRNLATALDLVFVYDAKVGQLLAELNGPQWFERKTSLTLRYAHDIAVASFEVVPLTLKPNVTLPDGHAQAQQVLLFANYLGSDGQYVTDITQFKHLQIQLLRDQYLLKELKPVSDD